MCHHFEYTNTQLHVMSQHHDYLYHTSTSRCSETIAINPTIDMISQPYSLYYFAHPTAQILYLIWQETLQIATSTLSSLKGNILMISRVNFICMLTILGKLCWLEFCKTVISKLFNVRFGTFSQNSVTINNFNHTDNAMVLFIHCLMLLQSEMCLFAN